MRLAAKRAKVRENDEYHVNQRVKIDSEVFIKMGDKVIRFGDLKIFRPDGGVRRKYSSHGEGCQSMSTSLTQLGKKPTFHVTNVNKWHICNLMLK